MKASMGCSEPSVERLDKRLDLEIEAGRGPVMSSACISVQCGLAGPATAQGTRPGRRHALDRRSTDRPHRWTVSEAMASGERVGECKDDSGLVV